MTFETAGIEIAVWAPPLVSFFMALLSSIGGLSGAFLLLPFQISVLGYTSPSVSATNQLYNIVAIPGGVFRYFREGRLLWPMIWVIAAGTLPGVLLGVWLRVEYLPDNTKFKLFAGIVLAYIGYRMLQTAIRPAGDKAEKNFSASAKSGSVRGIEIIKRSLISFSFRFGEEVFVVRNIPIALISLIVGILGGVYGIGGGAIMAPFLIAVLGLPVYVVAGATLSGTLLTSVAAVLFFELLAPYYPGQVIRPDYLLGLMFGLGGLAGTYTGAMMQKYLPARLIKSIITIAVLIIALKYILGYWGLV